LFETITLEDRTISVVTSGLSLFCLQTKAKLHGETQDIHPPKPAISATKDLICIYQSVS